MCELGGRPHYWLPFGGPGINAFAHPSITPDQSEWPDDADFARAIAAFFDVALTPELKAAGRETIGVYSDLDAGRVWWERLARRGWIAPSWPEAYGGAGWSPRRRFLFERACAEADAPVLFAGGLRSLGPLLIEQGSEVQQRRYLPAILSGRELWCQGFSEPGAGSDLASVSLRARRDGDAYVLDGEKIWTTGAHEAQRMFALVRTARGERAQAGLSFLLVDMRAPGLSVRPIHDLTGAHELNGVYFDGVRVPVADRVGAENEGWAIAKRLMELARSNNTPSALVRRVYRKALAGLDALAPEDRLSLSRRLAALGVELTAYEQLELAALPSNHPRSGEPSTASMLKVLGTELHQRMTELALEIRGAPAVEAEIRASILVSQDPAMAKYLATRAATIYSGASEVQRNVMWKALAK